VTCTSSRYPGRQVSASVPATASKLQVSLSASDADASQQLRALAEAPRRARGCPAFRASGAPAFQRTAMSPPAARAFSRAKSALPNKVKAKTPSLSLRLTRFGSTETHAKMRNTSAFVAQNHRAFVRFVAPVCGPHIPHIRNKPQRATTPAHQYASTTQGSARVAYRTAITAQRAYRLSGRCPVDYKMQALLDSIPDSPTRSRLEPYRELIRALRQKRKTFAEIAQILLLNYNVRIDPSNIHRFVKVRSKQSRLEPVPQLPNATSSPNIATQSAGENAAPKKRFHYDPEQGLTLPEEALNLKPRKD
jgi:hypothetical protein